MTLRRLAKMQTDFAAALLDPQADATIAPAWSGGDRAVERIGIYRANLFAVWEKTLSAAFPVVRAIVGADFFASMARLYGQSDPSICGDLNRFNARFPRFVRNSECMRKLPYLADVADLESVLHQARFAADKDPVAQERLASLVPRELLATRFGLHPACTWISSQYPIATIWQAHQVSSPNQFSNALNYDEIALVYRANWEPSVVKSCKGEIAALRQLRNGRNIEIAIGAALEAEPEYDCAQGFARWMSFRLLCAYA